MPKNILADSPQTVYQKAKNQVFPKNLILYGPPGTGKTYQATHYAIAMIEGKSIADIAKEKREEVMRRFNEYQREGQIEWATFHQSYGYEDFVQGIKPNTQVGTLLFEKKDGIFKRIADRARRNFDLYTDNTRPAQVPFLELLNVILSKNINPDTEEIEFELDSNHRIYKSIIVFDITEQGLVYRRKTKNDIIKNEDKVLYFNKLQQSYEGGDIQEAINEKYYQAVIETVKTYAENQVEPTETKQLRNYVLIIDEINRANISRVLGELITLLEEDKRYGSDNALSVVLPSGENFAVPANLYLLGTMNTADKSIALLDIALRRRFSFEAIYPQPDLIENTKIKAIMLQLNQAIFAEKRSADFLLGHAFFMHKTEADLPHLLQSQILPLLLEYFPNRTDKVLKILKEAGIQAKEEGYLIRVS
jgi:5-methylcytosine-specific restriction protein B